VALGFVATLFLKEIPLQKRYQIEEDGEGVPTGPPAQEVVLVQAANAEPVDCPQQDKDYSSSEQDAKPPP
jgi:hypothetical protein